MANNKTEIIEATPAVPASPVEAVQQGLALVRAENDLLQMAATRRPRDLQVVRQRAIAELQAFPELADGSWYSIPYRQRNPDGSVKTVYVEGPSVKAARRLAQAWGNLSVGARIVDATEDKVVIEGVALDLETAYRYSVPVVVSRYERNRKTGQLIRLPEDRWHVRIQAAMAKAVRNAIFGVLPEGLVQHYVNEAKNLVEQKKASTPKKRGRKPTKQIREAIVATFAPLGLTEEHLKALTGLQDIGKADEETRSRLRGLAKALEDGQVTVEEVLSTISEEEEKAGSNEGATLEGTLNEEEER